MSEAKLGTFDDLLASTNESLRPVMQRIRTIILEILPNASEVVRLGDGAATYGLGPRKMIEGVVYLAPIKGWINLGFYQGALLPDPQGLLEGTGKKLRHVKLHNLDACERPGLRQLIRSAVDERVKALGE
jgi:hypothetical protein